MRAIGLVLLVLLVACDASGPGSGPATPGVRESVSPAELRDEINRGDAPLILDVRSDDEFASGHIHGAMHVPHTEIAAHLDEIRAAAGDEIVVYCARGGRARIAIDELTKDGLHAIPLEGSMRGWLKAGYETEKDGTQKE